MKKFNKLERPVDKGTQKNIFMTTNIKQFEQKLSLSNTAIRKSFNFAYEMAGISSGISNRWKS